MIYLNQMSTHKANNIFSAEQIEFLNKLIENTKIPTINGEYIDYTKNKGTGICSGLGRIQIGDISKYFSEDINKNIYELVAEFTDAPLRIGHALYTEYNKKYGEPNLPPHFDADTNDLVINFQLNSNTQWDVGVNLEVYTLNNNSALLFNGNTEIHWRTHKEFKKGEYVKMLLIRLYNYEKTSDYTHLTNDLMDESFKSTREFRDSLK